MDANNPLEFASRHITECLESWYLVGFDYNGTAVAWSQEKSDKDAVALTTLMFDQAKDRVVPIAVISCESE